MKASKLITLTISVLLLVSFLPGCAQPPVAETEAPVVVTGPTAEGVAAPVVAERPAGMYPGPVDGNMQKYALVVYVVGEPYWNDEFAGCEAAAALLGVECKLYGPTGIDSQEQASIVDQLVASGIDGIILSPFDPDVLAGPAERAMAAGIPVVTVISDINSPRGTGTYGWLGGVNYGVGVVGGTYIAENLCKDIDPCGVGILTMTSVTVHEQRKAGYVETLAQYPNIKVVEIADTRSDPNIGLQKAAEMIQKYPELKVLVGTDSVGGAAASRAVTEAGKVGEIKIIGMDRNADLLQAIKDGTVTATIASKSFTTEFMALHYVYWLKNNFMGTYLDWKAAGINPLPTITDTSNMVITQDNVDFFLPKP